jgi:hypothetical protein
MKKILSYYFLSSVFIFYYGVSFGQVNLSVHPAEINYCTFLTYDVQPGQPACISYKGKYVNNSAGKFSNAPNGNWASATPSPWLAVIYPKWGRVAVFVNENTRMFEIYTSDNKQRLLGRQDYFSFVGWDNNVYDVSFNDLIGPRPAPPPPNPCPRVQVDNGKCSGDACNFVTITFPGQGTGQVNGLDITNNSSCSIKVGIRFAIGLGCMGESNFTLGPKEKKHFLNGGYCNPYHANFQ